MAPEGAPDFDEVIQGLVDRPAWHQRAACRDADTELFFPSSGRTPNEALSYCADCPVRWTCREAAMADPLTQGVWGGTTGLDRRRLRSSISASQDRSPVKDIDASVDRIVEQLLA